MNSLGEVPMSTTLAASRTFGAPWGNHRQSKRLRAPWFGGPAKRGARSLERSAFQTGAMLP